MSDGKRIGLYGRSGSGKSTLMNAIIAPQRHLVLFDYLPTRRQFAQANGLIECATLSQVRDVIADGYGQGFRVWFRPPADSFAQVDALHGLASFIWRVQEKRVDQGKMVPLITLAVDEMSECYPVANLPRDRQGMTRLCKAGRHYRINLVGATQRPAQVSTEFRGNLDVRYFLSLKEPADIKAVTETAGREVADQVAALPPYRFLRLENGQIRAGATRC